MHTVKTHECQHVKCSLSCAHTPTHTRTRIGGSVQVVEPQSQGADGDGSCWVRGERMVYPQNGTHPTVPFTKLHRRDKRKYCVNYYSLSQLIIKLKQEHNHIHNSYKGIFLNNHYGLLNILLLLVVII